jgi:hypothetical protein
MAANGRTLHVYERGAAMIADLVVGRLGTVDDVAAVIEFLVGRMLGASPVQRTTSTAD